MRQPNKRLSVKFVETQKIPGRYADGYGLYLQVSENGGKSWLLRYQLNGKSHHMGLGPIALLSLAEAREKALRCQRLLLEGIDPLEDRRSKEAQQALEAAKVITFDQCAAAYIEAHSPKWKNLKHIDQWKSSLEQYASPVIGALPVQSVDSALVIKILEPMWREKTETASRLRGRIEAILNWAAVRKYRTGENPARWRGHLKHLLPERSEIAPIVHFAALPINEMPQFMTKLRAEKGISPLALEFAILTASRTGEAIGAKWSEFNIDERVWTIPADRMKAGVAHRVPLSDRALDILNGLRQGSASPYVFLSERTGRPLSNMSLLQVIKVRMGYKVTSHGFRSTFKDWCSEHTTFPREVSEAALAHTLKDKVEAAYRRGDLFLKRIKLMNRWADFCSRPVATPGQVVEIASGNRLKPVEHLA